MANPTPAQLEARLKYFVPRLNASVARLEKPRGGALAAATVRPLPKNAGSPLYYERATRWNTTRTAT